MGAPLDPPGHVPAGEVPDEAVGIFLMFPGTAYIFDGVVAREEAFGCRARGVGSCVRVHAPKGGAGGGSHMKGGGYPAVTLCFARTGIRLHRCVWSR